MSLMDEFKAERESIKQASLKKKLEYFWDYYKWHTIGAFFVLIAIGMFMYTASKSTETIFYAIFFNTDLSDSYNEEMSTAFLDYVDIEDEKQTAIIDTGFYLSADYYESGVQSAHQKLSIFTSTNQLDILGGPMESINVCMYDSYLCDLRTILTEEQLEKYEPYFLYSDAAILEAKQEAAKNSETFKFAYPDPAKPEIMENPIPVAIDVSNCEKLQMIYPQITEQMAVGISVGTIQQENARCFIDYLFEE